MKHKICWHAHAWEDYLYWFTTDKRLIHKINELIKAVDKDPFDGIGQPEPLRHELSGFWSRRITQEHRLIYCADKETITIAACRYHYLKVSK